MVRVFAAARMAALAITAIGGAAFMTPGDAHAQGYGWSGPYAHSYRVTHRPAYRHGRVAPRRVVVPHRRVHRPVYYAPVRYTPRRCVIRQKWVHTYYGPQLVRQRVCYRHW
jgi:hypothetical protein